MSGDKREVDADEFVEKFVLTFSYGDYDAEFDNALCLDRNESVTLPVRPTQASYNKPDNWIERNQIGLEKVRIQLQNCINSVGMIKSVDLMLRHNRQWGPQILMVGEEPKLFGMNLT
jgi:hypothetical protein